MFNLTRGYDGTQPMKANFTRLPAPTKENEEFEMIEGPEEIIVF